MEGADAISSSFLRHLHSMAPPGMRQEEVFRYACKCIQFYAPLPKEMLDASSTLRELYGIYIFLMAFAAYLAKGRHLVIIDEIIGSHARRRARGPMSLL